jgi:hypothetical protein
MMPTTEATPGTVQQVGQGNAEQGGQSQRDGGANERNPESGEKSRRVKTSLRSGDETHRERHQG